MKKFFTHSFYFVLFSLCLTNGIENSFSQNINSIVGYTGYANNGWNADGAPAASSQVSNPNAVAADAVGNIYISDGSNLRIRKITPGGIITTLAGETNGSAGYSASTGVPPITVGYQTPMYDVELDASGNIYFVERDRVRKITVSSNLVSITAGSTLASGVSAGDGGSATAGTVRVNRMSSIAVDASGNIYIVDRGNHRIRKVTFSTGILSTVAGTGTAGYNGDGIAATTAQLNFPHGVAVDAAGNVYIGDRDNSRIRKITVSTGIITTIAGNGTAGYTGDGGAANAAEINLPTGVCVDASNNIYFTDQNNFAIRKITASTGIISTVAGTGAAGYNGDGISATTALLSFPVGVIGTAGTTINLAVDISGNIFIPDYSNQRFRKVEASTGMISTIAGTGTQGYLANGGPSTSQQLWFPKDVEVDAAGNLFVVQNSGAPDCVWKVNSSGIISIYAGTGGGGAGGDGGLATAAQIQADGVTVDPSGNVFIASGNYSRIRKIDGSTGIITTYAGTGTAGYNGDGIAATTAQINFAGSGYTSGMAADAAGNLYFCDDGNSRVRKITASTGIISTVAGNGTAGFLGDGGAATSARLDVPLAVAVDGAGNIYIADANNHRVRKVTFATGIITTIAGTAAGGGYNGDGIAATTAQLFNPRGIAVDGSNNVYIGDMSNNRVRKITAGTGIISTIAGTGVGGLSGDGGPATSAQIFGLNGVSTNSGANCIYIADWNNSRVRVVDNGGSCMGLMPVEMLSFVGKYSERKTILHWTTASEKNNDYFTVEQSEDAKTWTEIGTVPGFGNSSVIQNYEFIRSSELQTLNSELTYYRLKQTDFDGKFSYSNIISVRIISDDGIIIQANSSKGQLFVSFSENFENKNCAVKIYDMSGRVCYSSSFIPNKSKKEMWIDCSSWSNGIYIIFANSENGISSQQKFIK